MKRKSSQKANPDNKENRNIILQFLEIERKAFSNGRREKRMKKSRILDDKIKRRIIWLAALGGVSAMIFVVVGIIITLNYFGSWFTDLGVIRNPAVKTSLDTEYRADLDVYRGKEWQEGDQIDRMRIREIMDAKRIEVKQVKAAQSVKERDIKLISTGFGEHRVPYAVMTIGNGQKNTYHVGDKILDGEVMGIFPNQVALELEGQRLILNVKGKDSDRQFKENEPDVEYVGDSNPVAASTETSRENKRRFAGETRMRRVDAGYTIVALDGHSPLGYTGIEKGDTIVEINGVMLDSRKGTILAYESLKRDSRVPIVFIRNGVTMTATADMP